MSLLPIASIPAGLLEVHVPINPAIRRLRQSGVAARWPSSLTPPPLGSSTSATTCASSSDSIFPSTPSPQPRLNRSPSIELLDAKGGTKRVIAEVVVQAPLETLWDVLTDYESLPSYVPNLETCEVLERHQGRVRLRQVGCSQSLLWRIAAEAELEIEEIKKSPLRREVRFQSLKGDFERFEGSWILESDVSSSAHMTTFLRYEIRVTPVTSLPAQIVSYVIKSGLPSNIRAIAGVAERRAAKRLKAPVVSLEGDDVGWEGGSGGELSYQAVIDDEENESLPRKGPFWSLRGSKYREAAPITGDLQQRRNGRVPTVGGEKTREEANSEVNNGLKKLGTDYLGTTFVPLPPSAPPTAATSLPNNSSIPNNSTPRDPIAMESSASFLSPGSANGIEVHLRRLDDLDYIHRRAVAAIRVNAPASVVWDVITDYNRLHRFIPALATSERIQLPRDAPNVKRVRQVAYKNLGYMCLHAESVMDLVERPCSELQFRQVAGDLDVIQGKIAMTEGLSTDEDYVGPSTDLKYAVEIILPAGTPAISVVEPLLEGVFFEDLPFNLAAVKAEIERAAVAQRVAGRPGTGPSGSKPRLGDMMRDFMLLRAELEITYGETRKIPTRNELRAAGRSDLEKCIAAHGGATAVAARMGWTTAGRARKPRGYWSSIENLKREIDDFIISSDLPPETMPLKATIVTSDRYDLVRAIEKWGGVSQVAEQLGYATASGGGSGGSTGSLSSVDLILSSSEFEDLMYVEVDDRGFNEKEEQEMMVLLEQQDDLLDAGRWASARQEIDNW